MEWAAGQTEHYIWKHHREMFLFSNRWDTAVNVLLIFTCDSSHHMLTPPLATLPDRTKYRLSGVRRKTHVFVSFEIVVMTPGEDEEEQSYKAQQNKTLSAIGGTESQ